MSKPRSLRSFTQWLFQHKQIDRDLHDEMQQHLEQRAADLMRGGMAPEEAWRRARLEFGSLIKYEEECRDTRRFELLRGCVADLRFTFRLLRRNPAFAALALFCLTLGIGAS